MKITSKMDVRELNKRIKKAVEMGKANKASVQKAYRRVGAIYVATARSMIKDSPKDIRVQRGDRMGAFIERGTLRRSMGTWNAHKVFPTILAGPRSNFPMKKKVREHSDAWFAHIVEEGDFPEVFGGKNASHPNYKVMERAMKASYPRMKAKLYQELRKEFEKLMK